MHVSLGNWNRNRTNAVMNFKIWFLLIFLNFHDSIWFKVQVMQKIHSSHVMSYVPGRCFKYRNMIRILVLCKWQRQTSNLNLPCQIILSCMARQIGIDMDVRKFELFELISTKASIWISALICIRFSYVY